MINVLGDKLVMIAELQIRPDQIDAFLDYTFGNLPVSRSYPGNIAFDMLIDEAQPDRVLFYEIWESSAAQRAYMAWRFETGDVTKLLSFLADTPRFTALRTVDDRR